MDQGLATPTQTPPGINFGDGGTTRVETQPTISDAAAAGAAEQAPQAPTAQPPAVAAAAATAAGGTAEAITGAWHYNLTVDALWAVNETRNAFMRVVGIGWKKLYNGSDGSFTALSTLASQARQTGKQISYRDEADGMVHEIYLW